jgi:putative ABC transport system permease protein
MRTPLSALVLVVGLALMALGLFGGKSGSGALAPLGAGAALVFLGVALVSSRLVPPIASLIGAPIERARGFTGRLARENTVRNAGRTASTAAALMIGLALVSGVTIFAAGLRHSIDDAIDKGVKAQVILENKDGFSSIPRAAGESVGRLDGAETVSPLRQSAAKVRGVKSTATVSGVDPRTLPLVYRLQWKKGSDSTLAALGPNDVLVSDSWSKSNDRSIGDAVTATTQRGRQLHYVIRGTYKNNAHFLGDLTVTNDTLAGDFGQRRDQYVFVGLHPGTDANAFKDRASALVKSQYPTAEAVTKSGFKDTQTNWVNKILAFFYVLLSLAVIVSLLGIVNTLVLAIYERTRELGMLRAIGTSRRQVRQIVRYESVITAMIGAVLGIVLGIFFAVIVSRPLANEGFQLSFPIVSLLILLVLAALAGVLAAITPARRAAKLDILQALSYE